jgi:hypothetical protein
MGYMHITNLYRPEAQAILLFKEVYALEKVHGTSAHISWRGTDGNPQLTYFAGGESHANFVAFFDDAALRAAFTGIGHPEVTVFGEAYGGKQQGMRHTYGDKLSFIVFDVKIGETWLAVPDAEDVAKKLGLEFVPYHKVATELSALDAERDRPSEVAVRRGVITPKPREGVVLRPLREFAINSHRIIVKHKGEAFSETKTPRPVADPAKLAVLTAASAIADEWVTPMRLEHILQRIPADDMSAAPKVIAAMVEDIYREGKGEVVESREATAAIGRKTAELLKKHLMSRVANV